MAATIATGEKRQCDGGNEGVLRVFSNALKEWGLFGVEAIPSIDPDHSSDCETQESGERVDRCSLHLQEARDGDQSHAHALS
jgi:hypothetical protein